MNNSEEDNPLELERLLASSRPTTDAMRTAELSYGAGVAAGRNIGLQPNENRQWLVVLSHSCSAVAGSLTMLAILSFGTLKWNSSQPEPVVAKSEASLGLPEKSSASAIVNPQAGRRSSSDSVLTSVLSSRLLDEIQWPPTNESAPESSDVDQPTTPFNTRSQIF